MIEAYILFALLTTDTPRPATWTAEFTSKERCMEAGRALQGMGKVRIVGTDKTYDRVSFVCTPR
jgi:hypothetical protein